MELRDMTAERIHFMHPAFKVLEFGGIFIYAIGKFLHLENIAYARPILLIAAGMVFVAGMIFLIRTPRVRSAMDPANDHSVLVAEPEDPNVELHTKLRVVVGIMSMVMGLILIQIAL